MIVIKILHIPVFPPHSHFKILSIRLYFEQLVASSDLLPLECLGTRPTSIELSRGRGLRARLNRTAPVWCGGDTPCDREPRGHSPFSRAEARRWCAALRGDPRSAACRGAERP